MMAAERAKKYLVDTTNSFCMHFSSQSPDNYEESHNSVPTLKTGQFNGRIRDQLGKDRVRQEAPLNFRKKFLFALKMRTSREDFKRKETDFPSATSSSEATLPRDVNSQSISMSSSIGVRNSSSSGIENMPWWRQFLSCILLQKMPPLSFAVRGQTQSDGLYKIVSEKLSSSKPYYGRSMETTTTRVSKGSNMDTSYHNHKFTSSPLGSWPEKGAQGWDSSLEVDRQDENLKNHLLQDYSTHLKKRRNSEELQTKHSKLEDKTSRLKMISRVMEIDELRNVFCSNDTTSPARVSGGPQANLHDVSAALAKNFV